MATWQHVPGAVVPCSLVLARCSAAAAASMGTSPSSLPLGFDADVTTGYVETILRHCSHSFNYGVATHLVLVGDGDWYNGILSNTIVTLMNKFVATARQLATAQCATSLVAAAAPSSLFDGSVHISGGTFRCSECQFDTNAVRLEVKPSDPVEVSRRVLGVLGPSPPLDSRSIAWIRMSLPEYCGCEISTTLFVLPPVDSMSWETHRYLRQTDDDLLLSRNALTMFVLHISSASLAGELRNPVTRFLAELLLTLEKQKQERFCAAIPNTPAAKFLLQGIDGCRARGGASDDSPLRGGHAQNKVASLRPDDARAMEAELVSLRAACLQLNARNQQLEGDIAQLKSLTAQQQQMHAALLDPRVVGGRALGDAGGAARFPVALGARSASAGGSAVLLPPLPEGSRVPNVKRGAAGAGSPLTVGGALVPAEAPSGLPMIYQQQQQSSSSSGGRGEVHEVFTTAASHLQNLTEMLQTIQSSLFTSEANDLLKACLVWRQRESTLLHTVLRTALQLYGRDLPPSAVARSSFGDVSIGVSTAADPLTALYRLRLEEVERELVRVAELDVDGIVSDFFTSELHRMEGEVVSWMAKYYATNGRGGGGGTGRSVQ